MIEDIRKILDDMINSHQPGDLLSLINFEELQRSKIFKQKDGRPVFQHTADVLNCLSIKNYITLLSAIFHDLGKINTRHIDNQGNIDYHEHPIESSRIAKLRLKQFGFDNSIISMVLPIIETHMMDLQTNLKESTIRKFVAKVGMFNVSNWFVLRIADIQSYPHHPEWHVTKIVYPFKNQVEKYVNEFTSKSKGLLFCDEGFRISGTKDE